jgi:tetratricopeptide (TPR) repeat protein
METTRTIEQYFDGTLGNEEKRAIEERTALDKDFRDLIRLHEEVNESIRDKDLWAFQKLIKTVSTGYFNTVSFSSKVLEKKRVKIVQSFFFRLAVMLVIAAVAGIILKITLFREMSAEKLYQKYYISYNADIILRSVQADETDLGRAILNYSSGKYSEALSILDDVTQIDKGNYVAQFYKGLTFLETGVPDKAIRAFKEIPVIWSNPLNEHRNWYLALAILRSRDKTEAVTAFEEISAYGGYYANRADKILQKLKP